MLKNERYTVIFIMAISILAFLGLSMDVALMLVASGDMTFLFKTFPVSFLVFLPIIVVVCALALIRDKK